MKKPLWMQAVPEKYRARLLSRERVLILVSSSGWLLLDKIVRLLLGLFVGVWVARYLGPAQYGELAYILAYIAFFQAVATLGLDSIIVRDISQSVDGIGLTLGSAFVARVIAGCVCWLAAVGLMVYMHGWSDRSVFLVMLAGGSLIFQAADTVDLWFQSQSQNKRTVVVKLTSYILSSAVKVFFILMELPLIYFAAVMTLDVVVVAVGLLIAYRLYPSEESWRASFARGKYLVFESAPLVLSALSIIIYMRIDQILIKAFLGDSEVGIYSAAVQFAQLPNFIPVAISTALLPFLSDIYKTDIEHYQRYLVLAFRVFFYAGLSLATVIILFSNEIVFLLYGADYSRASDVLKWYSLSSCFVWLGVAHNLWLINHGKYRVRVVGTVLAGVVALIFGFYFLPIFGVISAAVVSILTQFIATFFINFFLAKESFYLQVEAIIFLRLGAGNA